MKWLFILKNNNINFKHIRLYLTRILSDGGHCQLAADPYACKTVVRKYRFNSNDTALDCKTLKVEPSLN